MSNLKYMYTLTLLILLISLILPILFVFPFEQKIEKRLLIFLFQIIFFVLWASIFRSVLYGIIPRSFSVFGTGAPESSIFMLNWLIEPLLLFFILSELAYILIYKLIHKK